MNLYEIGVGSEGVAIETYCIAAESLGEAESIACEQCDEGDGVVSAAMFPPDEILTFGSDDGPESTTMTAAEWAMWHGDGGGVVASTCV